MTTQLVALYQGREYRRAADAVSALAEKFGEAGRRDLPPLIRKALEQYLFKVAQAVKARNSKGYPDGTSPSGLSSRSGRAMESVINSPRVNNARTIQAIEGHIGGVGYLRIHEFGGVIRPRTAQYLTVPLPAALNSDGTPKRRTAREWSDTFIQRSRAGNLIIFQSRGSEIVPLYVLKEEVYIPPRLGMSLTLDQFIDQFLGDIAKRVRREFMS